MKSTLNKNDMANKIKTDHPFTAKQLKALNIELAKISNTEVIALRGPSIPGKNNYTDIEVKHSPFNLDVFLFFTNISNPDAPKSEVYAISAKGAVDKQTRSNMSFNSLADRMTFFNQLTPVNFSL